MKFFVIWFVAAVIVALAVACVNVYFDFEQAGRSLSVTIAGKVWWLNVVEIAFAIVFGLFITLFSPEGEPDDEEPEFDEYDVIDYRRTEWDEFDDEPPPFEGYPEDDSELTIDDLDEDVVERN